MGTNYYATPPNATCPTCGHCEDGELHIGKSSCGWAFSLRIHPDRGINTLDDWRKRWDAGWTIRDEYSQAITPGEMLSTITERSHPQGLSRHTGRTGHPGWQLDVKHSDGTYDLCNYEFC